MNSKVHVLLISTRKLSSGDAIFAGTRRCEKQSNSLKSYFVSSSQNALRQLLISQGRGTSHQESSHNEPGLSLDIAKDIYNSLPQKYKNDQVLLAELSTCLRKGIFNPWIQKLYDALSKDLTSESPTENNSRISQIRQRVSQYLPPSSSNQLPENEQSFTESDFDDYLHFPAINIDQESEAKEELLDRISLFSLFPAPQINDGIVDYYLVFAIWPLGNPDQIVNNSAKQSKWVEELSCAANEEVNRIFGIVQDSTQKLNLELILLLHDNDLSSTRYTPFKTIFINETINDTTCTLAVYQHSNKHFINIINRSSNANARDVYDIARKEIVNDLCFQKLSRLSTLVTFSAQNINDNDCICIKGTLDWFENNNLPWCKSETFVELKELLNQLIANNNFESEQLLEANRHINKLIREVISTQAE